MTTPKTPQTAPASLVAALAELDNVKANKINPAFKARYVSLDALLDAIKPVLLDHDLALIQTLVSEDGKVGVSTAFLHASGERFDFGKLMVKAEGLTAQQIGGAITYIRRQYTIDGIRLVLGTYEDIATPVLQVHGSRDASIPIEAARGLTPRLRDARFVVVEGASHDVHIDAPDELVAAIEAFELETGSGPVR